MQISFDPNNREECALIRQLFRSTVEAPPVDEYANVRTFPASAAEAAADKPKRGRPAKTEASAPTATECVATQAAAVAAIPANVEKSLASLVAAVEKLVEPVQPVQPLFTIIEVRAKLTQYSADSDEATAKALLLKVGGVARLSEVPAAKYGDILKAINDATATLPKKG